VEYVTDRQRNPFGLDPPCERAVPGYGDANAHFHVVGDSPDVHGGTATGIPFTGKPWSERFFAALGRGGLVDGFDPAGPALDAPGTFLSYLSMCPLDGPGVCGGSDTAIYAEMEPFFDAELRAITAHVIVPVGARATEHVLESYTSVPADRAREVSHASTLDGAGWLVVPVADPADWTDHRVDALVDTLCALRERDYRQQSDLGRFFPGEEPYLVR
jgi:uracil-DNA glycosylase